MTSSLINNKKYYNLSEPQKLIYIGEMMNPNTSLNTITISLKMPENTDDGVMKKAIEYVVLTNAGFSLRITTKKGIPYQYVETDIDYQVELLDFRISNGDLTELCWLNQKINSIFNLENSILFNINLFYGYDESLNILLQTHHIISDGFTNNSIVNQIHEKYEFLKKNNENKIIHRYSYLEYLGTEKVYLESKRCKKSGDFWRLKFQNVNGFETLLKRKNIKRGLKAKRFQNNFNSLVQEKIIRICDDNNISYSTFFLTCLLISLKNVSGGEKYLLGTSSYNRLGSKEKEAVGMFVNILPLYFDIDKDYNFKAIAERVDTELAGLMRHQRYPLNLIANDPELKNLNISKSIEIIYTYQNPVFPYEYIYHFSNYNSHPILFRSLRTELTGNFHLEIDYQVNCFSDTEIKNISDVYQNVIESLDSNITKPLVFNNISEKKNMEKEYVYKNPIHNLSQTLHGIFEKKVSEFGDNKAVSCISESLTYYELNRRANYLSELLIKNGAGYEKPVVLLMDRSVEMMVSILAVLKSGSCYLPLSPEQPLIRSTKIIKLSNTAIVLYNSDVGLAISNETTNIDIRDIEYPGIDIPNPSVEVNSDNLAYIIYTSGSTGEPKGVMLEHKAVINRLFWMQDSYPIGESDKLLQKTPYTFDVSIWELFWWYFNNSSMHFLIPGGEKEPEAIVKEIKEQNITIIHFVPSMLSLFLEYVERGNYVEDIKSLKRIICSGEALLLKHVKQFIKLINSQNGTTLHNLYGPTEAAVDVTSYNCTGNETDYIPIGKPIDNVELYVLDKNGEVLPPGSSGELFIGGVCLARGYFNKPELTDEKFKFNSSLGKKLYSTGDLATYLDDGNIKYIGRIDNQVKIRGNRVELGEIESCLLLFDGIYEAAVIALTDENGSAYLGAYIVANGEILHEDLRHFIKNELPSYMVPSYFVQMDEFPLSSSGKLDRKALPEPEDRIHQKKKYHAPVNEREEEICEIWEDVLKLEKIGRHDNFFTDLGGDSLSLIQVMFPLQDKYELSLQDLFEFQTIETLSQHIHQRSAKNVEFKKDSFENLVKQFSCMDKIQEYNRSYVDLPVMKEVVYSNLLVTGSTGFLGAYLVKEYLENSETHLHLLIRGNSLAEAESRLKAKMTYYFGNDFYGKFSRRITVVNGDLTKDNFGIESDLYKELSKTVEGVVHSAANVKHYGDRDDIYNINVNGTKNVLSFCNSGLLKKIFFVSTASVGLNSVNPGWIYNFTEFDIAKTDNCGNVYIDSKIVAEEAVRTELSRLGGQILRVGNLVNDLETGKFQENRHNNAFYSLMMEYKKRRIAPIIEIPFIDLSFVNETAKAITVLSMCDRDGTYHLLNPNKITIKEMCANQGIEHVEFQEFIDSLNHGDSLLTHGYYLLNSDLLGLNYFNDLTNHVLEKLGFSWSSIGQDEVNTLWLDWLK